MSLQRSLRVFRLPVVCNGCRHILNVGTCKTFSSQRTNIGELSTSTYEEKESMLKRVLSKIPFNFNKNKLNASGYFLYEGIVDKINHLAFFEEFRLPDTFYSWFVVTELHIWMLSARAMAEGEDGRILRNSLVEALWTDVQQRTKKLGAANPAGIRIQISELSEQLQAALIAYDEGILSDDVVLAGALWRRIFQYGPFEPEKLELLVHYVRKQMYYLDSLPKQNILFKGQVEWIPLQVRI